MTGDGVTELFLVPHTHWDREWYEPFEGFLARLIQMMELLIELAEREPRFTHFHLDGQSALIDDYLAARPEREQDVRALAREGRISVGPWFTQMDEFLTSGESHIRNLEWGLARANDLGADRPFAGYLPDQFGHIGQMPQILRHAGIERAVVWRGVPAAVDRTAFWWAGPDGSRVLAEYLAFGYSVGWRVGQAEDAEGLRQALAQAVEWLQPPSTRRTLLVTVGTDHTVPAARLAGLLEEVNQREELQGRIGSLADYLRLEEPSGNLPVWRGELRSAARAHLLPNVYSARPHQKLARAQVESTVERWAEPFAALVPGVEWPAEELDQAWRLLLWNGAHDSVCGCSVDQVARDVDGRYAEAQALASRVFERARDALAARMSARGWMYLNPSPFERDGIPGLGWLVIPDDQEGPPWRAPKRHPEPFHPPVRLVEDGDGWISGGGFRVRLVDEGDAGDLYTYCPTSEAPPAGPLSIHVQELEQAPPLPREHAGSGPYEVMTAGFDSDLAVDLWAERHPDEGCLLLSVRVRNDRPDHRLRLHVELDEPAAGSVAMAPFEVVDRPLRSEGGTETPSPTWPARGAVSAGGISVFHPAVFEYEVVEDRPELAITLLRAVGTISRGSLSTRAGGAGPDIATPEAQLLGRELYVRLTLHRGVAPPDLPAEWERHQLPMWAVRAPGGGDLPDRGSLLEVEGAELSSVRKVDGRVQVRIWNPSLETRTARVAAREVTLGPARIETVDLE